MCLCSKGSFSKQACSTRVLFINFFSKDFLCTEAGHSLDSAMRAGIHKCVFMFCHGFSQRALETDDTSDYISELQLVQISLDPSVVLVAFPPVHTSGRT